VESPSEALAGGQGLEEFVKSVARISPLLPGGGSVAALAGSLAAALGEMMSGVTEGRQKYSGVDSRVRAIHACLTKLRNNLRVLVQEDASAFGLLLTAFKLPKDTLEQRAARVEAIEEATKIATDTPLRIARASSEVLESIRVLVDIGNKNARCDAAVGAQMAFAAIKGAQYNVLVNTSGLKDEVFAKNSRTEILKLVLRGQQILQQVDEIITGP
jgi:formiminotetrahydrofolate cyclodeaminase